MKNNFHLNLVFIFGFVAIVTAPVGAAPGGTNLIVNGGFEHGAGFPAGWQVDLWTGSHYNPGEFKAIWDNGEFHGGTKSIRLSGSGIQDVGREICRIGVRSSSVILKPDTEYHLSFWYKTAKGIQLQQKYQPAWVLLRGPQTDWGRWNDRRFEPTDGQWVQEELTVRSLSDKPESANVEFRNCGQGEVWFDDVSLTSEGKNETITIKGKKWTILPHKEDHPAAPVTADDQARGYVLFSRDDPTGVYPNSFPADGESIQSLRTFATPGEYELVQFAVYPLKDLTGVKVRVSDLKNEQGAVIGSKYVEVRTVKCWLQCDRNVPGDDKIQVVPELLEKAKPLDLKAKVAQQYWLTVHVPKDAAPGRYTGTIDIQVAAGGTGQLELGLRVLPFTLIEEVPYPIGWYADISAMGPSHKMTRYTWDEVAARFKDMKDHGMTCMVYNYPDSVFVPDDFRRLSVGKKLRLDFATDNKVIRYYQAAGFTGPVILELSRLTALIADFLGLDLPASYYRDGRKGTSESLYILESEATPEFVATFKEAIRQIDQNAKRNHWPPLYYYVVDEPGYQGERALTAARLQHQWIKEAVPGAKTYCTIYEADLTNKYLVPYLNVRTSGLTGEKDLKDNEEQTRKYGVEQWGIGGPEDMEKIAFNYGRLGVGFALKKARQTGMTFWRYGNTMEVGTNYSAKNGDWDPYCDMRGGSTNGKDFAISYRSPQDGSPVPTIGWEGLREGVDDLRYMLTLERHIGQCEKSGDAKIKAAGIQARKTLDDILAKIPWKIKTKDWWSDKGVSNGEMTKYRWMIALEILRLSDMLKK